MITLDHGLQPTLRHEPLSNRKFGLLLGCVGAFWATVPVIFSRSFHPRLLAAALILMAVALLLPRSLTYPKIGWMAVTSRIGVAVTFLLLVVAFFLVVTPVALFFRLTGRDVLKRRFDKNIGSYWLPKESPAPSSMKNQF